MNLASRIDHTILKAEATETDVRKAVAEAIAHRFAGVCVNGVCVAGVRRLLAGTGVKCCAVAGFPLGAGKTTIKAIEATAAAKDGAEEIDFVVRLPLVLAGDLAGLKADMIEVVRAIRAVNPAIVAKVILETALLLKVLPTAAAEAAIAQACQAARETGCDFVKTSTGFHPAGGASVEAVRLLKKHAGGLKVKAAGGIRTYDDAMRMIDAGADRLGCSASVAIVTEAGTMSRP